MQRSRVGWASRPPRPASCRPIGNASASRPPTRRAGSLTQVRLGGGCQTRQSGFNGRIWRFTDQAFRTRSLGARANFSSAALLILGKLFDRFLGEIQEAVVREHKDAVFVVLAVHQVPGFVRDPIPPPTDDIIMFPDNRFGI